MNGTVNPEFTTLREKVETHEKNHLRSGERNL
jgi:hypothetical protein